MMEGDGNNGIVEMTTKAEKEEKERLETTLACMLQGMAGKKIYVELRKEDYVFGILESCDSYMNMKLKDATVIMNCKSTTAEEFYVSGRYVRFVHFEHKVDSEAAMRRYHKEEDKKRGGTRPNRRLDQLQSNSTRVHFE